jgi:transcriptional regulator with XRE-family HTH domain
MSQQALAEQLGVSFQQLQKYEKGSNRVGGGRLSRIASIFSVPIATLFEGTAAEGSRPAEASALRLIADRQPMRLVQAFAQLRNRNIRLSIVKLVERLAKDSPTRHRRACPGDPDELSKVQC